MGSLIGTLFAFALVFGILVFAHEFGHFFMAKLVKIKVEVFSFGYGKRLFGLKKGDTDYRVSLIPMGGYVKFPGEEVLEQKRELAPGDFMAAKRWQRFLVLLMGSSMNIFLAIVLMTFINMVGVNVPQFYEQRPVIGWIEPGSPAELASLQIDDEILKIDDKGTKTWSDVEIAVVTKPKKTISLEIKRGDKVIIVKLLTESKTETKTRYKMGYAGFFGKILTQVAMVQTQSPAEKAGLKAGDVILAINSQPIFFFHFTEIIQKNPEKELDLMINRAGKILTLKVTPKREGQIGIIGINPTPEWKIKKYGFFSAFAKSYEDNKKLAFLVINIIKDLITGQVPASQVSGPIDIANLSYIALQMGFITLLGWIALISLQLGIINLFPIPVLDGGQIFVLALEGIFRRDFSANIKQIVMKIGFAIFISLIIFVILNDVAKRLPNGWQSILPF